MSKSLFTLHGVDSIQEGGGRARAKKGEKKDKCEMNTMDVKKKKKKSKGWEFYLVSGLYRTTVTYFDSNLWVRPRDTTD